MCSINQSIFICIAPNHNKVISKHFPHRAGSKPNSSGFNFKETQHSHMRHRKNPQNQTQSGRTSAWTGWSREEREEGERRERKERREAQCVPLLGWNKNLQPHGPLCNGLTPQLWADSWPPAPVLMICWRSGENGSSQTLQIHPHCTFGSIWSVPAPNLSLHPLVVRWQLCSFLCLNVRHSRPDN